ncbi:MAG: peptidyl-prolyl cis-trans isomerase [Nitrospirota bacterium]
MILLGLFFFSCKQNTDGSKQSSTGHNPADMKVVATVNGNPITLGEFRERFTRAGFKWDRETAQEIKEEFLNRLIERTMMLREAQRRRITIGLPEINARVARLSGEYGKDVKDELATRGIDFEKWKSDIWEELMIERLMTKEIYHRVSVSPAEMRKYYQANSEQFVKPEQVHVRQIVTATQEDARKVLSHIHAGGDFAALAKERSTAPEGENGGDLGYFSLGEMPQEFNVVFTLQKGQVSEIVSSPYGFHIFKLVDKRPAGKISYEQASKEIEALLRKEKEDKRYKQWFKELRSRTKFTVNYQGLEQ